MLYICTVVYKLKLNEIGKRIFMYITTIMFEIGINYYKKKPLTISIIDKVFIAWCSNKVVSKKCTIALR